MTDDGAPVQLVRVFLASGESESVVAEVEERDIPDDVVLAAPDPGKKISELNARLEDGLHSIRPAVTALVDALKPSGPDSVGVEFGIKLGGEAGVILARGTAEVNFKVVMEWRRFPSDGNDGDAASRS